MAQINLSFEHGQTPDAARAIFATKMEEASTQYAKWMERVEWSPDRTSVTVYGSGIEVRVWCDDREIHAAGKVPMFVKLFEGTLRAMVQRTLDVNLPK